MRTPISRHRILVTSSEPYALAAKVLLAVMLIGANASLTRQAAAQFVEDDSKKERQDKLKPIELPKRIIDREPFDRITLDAKNRNYVFDVYALPPKEREMVERADPNGKLKVRMLNRPDFEFELSTGAVVNLQIYEKLLMAEAARLVNEKQFDEAFAYYDRLTTIAPNTPNLKAAIHSYLYLNAGNLFGQQRYSEALSLLEELYNQNPDFQAGAGSVAAAIAKMTTAIMNKHLEAQDYLQARRMVQRITQKYGDKQKDNLEKWIGQLSSIASKKRDEAKAHFAAKRYSQAIHASKEMLSIWPDLAGGRELAKQISDAYPMVVVGVTQVAASSDSGSFDDWGSRRTGRLVKRRLCEFADRGPEGGLYESPLGTLDISDDNRELSLTLDPRKLNVARSVPITGYEVARQLSALATPGDRAYLPAWSSLVSGISVRSVNSVRIELRRPHVLPVALLQTLVDTGADSATNGPYLPGAKAAESLHFLANDSSPFAAVGQPREVVERRFANTEKGLNALRRGEIDILDRVFPADVPRLKKESLLAVGAYTLPTMHMLIPNPDRPFTANRTFRRALLYAINRGSILGIEILGGADVAGCQEISGPVPAGFGPNDPLAYAYDEKIEPRPYNPYLALALKSTAEKELKLIAEKKMTTPPTLGELVLGYPTSEVARVACQSIESDFKVIGLNVKLRELTPEEFSTARKECDLLYVELALWEPAVDAARLFGTKGYFPDTSPYVGLALRRLEAARDWKESSAVLKELHRIVFDDVTVLPLWQLTEHFAYRKWLSGVKPNSVQLYQHIEQWRIAVRTAEE